jgi:hypothetical protein
MAMTIFMALNGLGVAFLLYVLAKLWIEGHRQTNADRKEASEFAGRDWTDVLVATHPISHSAQGGLSVIPFQARGRFGDTLAHRAPSDGTSEVPVRRISTR